MKQILCCKYLGVKVLNRFNAPSESVEYRVSVAEQLTGRSGTEAGKELARSESKFLRAGNK